MDVLVLGYYFSLQGNLVELVFLIRLNDAAF